MKPGAGTPAWMYQRVTLQLAIKEAVVVSRDEPHRVFWLHAIRCPGCRRHAVAMALSSNAERKDKPKYTLCTITNGEVIPRGLKH